MKVSAKILALFLAACMLASCGAKAPQNSESVSAPSDTAVEQPKRQLPMPAEGISPITGLAARHPGQRPFAVMVYNEKAGRPQWGLASADLMVEANIEGQDSRLMTVYEGYEDMEKVGPVGPARDLFMQFIMPFGTVPMFIGADVYTSNLLNLYAYQPLDGQYAGVSAFDYDSSRRGVYRSQYCWYAHKALIPDALEQYGQSTQGETPLFFEFADGSAPQNTNGLAVEIVYGDRRGVLFEYDGSRYLMKDSGDYQWDGNVPDQPVGVDNVLVLMASSGFKDNGVTRDYDLTEGAGIYLCRGGSTEIRWQKGGPGDPLYLFDAAGNRIAMQPGKTYLGVWGGFAGQSLKLFGADWTEQPIPAAPAPIATPEPTADPAAPAESAPAEPAA